MNRTLFAQEVRSNLFVLGVFFAVSALYIASVVVMFDPELEKSLSAMMQSMPELFEAFGMATPTTTLLGFMLNYLYGLLLTLFPFALILILVNKLMVRRVDRGTMSYLLATPNSRTRIVLTLIGALIALLAILLALITAVEVSCGGFLFPGELDIEGLMRANAGLFALWLFLSGACFLSACLFSNAGRALWAGGGLCILLFLMQMMAKVGEDLEFLNNVNPLTLYDSYGLAAGDASAYAGAAALAVVGVALLAAAAVVFDRRDLSM